MSDATVQIIVAVIGAFGAALTALIGLLTKKGLDFLDARTRFMDAENQVQRKEAIKKQVAETAELAAASTMQTYVDELKKGRADGKLTKEEGREALRRARETATGMLKSEGIEVARELLFTNLEAAVGRLKLRSR